MEKSPLLIILQYIRIVICDQGNQQQFSNREVAKQQDVFLRDVTWLL